MTKKEKNTAVFTGMALFIIAAVFSISLISGFFNYDGKGRGLTALGSMLISVYGICSILIPAFFLVAGIFSFSSKWSGQRALGLGISILPFFTLAGAENICRKIADTDVSAVAIMKIAVFLIIAFLIVALEYLLAFVIYSKIKNLKSKRQKNKKEDLDFAEFSDDEGAENFETEIEAKEKDGINDWALTDVLTDEKSDKTQEVTASGNEEDIWSLDDNGNLKSQVAANGGNTDFESFDDSEDPWNVTGKNTENNETPEGALDPLDVVEFDSAEDSDYEDDSDNLEKLEPIENLEVAGTEPETASAAEEIWAKNPNDIEVVELRDIVDPTIVKPDAEDEFDDDIISQFEKDSIGFDKEETDTEPADDPIDFEINFDEPEPDFFISDRSVKVSNPEYETDSENSEESDAAQDEILDFGIIESDDSKEHESHLQEKKTELELNNALGSIFSRMEDDAKKSVENGAADSVDDSAEKKISPVHKKHSVYNIPTDILTAYDENPYWIIDEETKNSASMLMETLKEFKIEAEVTDIKKGPVVTMFEILPAPGVNLNKIRALQDNITLRLAAKSVRIVAPIPGKRAVGIEIPNKKRAVVSFRECIEENRPEWKKMAVPVVLGKDIEGGTQIMDLAKTPHLLIAGATGAGKSVCVNSLILSILYKRSPNDVKLILIDPKIVELSLYNGIGHLLTPVITEPKMAMQALQYCICEMERRYAVLKSMGCREIVGYNQKIKEQHIATEKLPYIIIVIDEFADLMATTGKQMEAAVARLAAKSRAVGIHLVLATQRPSVDVITGLIKANIPSRIAFMVASRTDSNIIIDKTGAEKLLGKGDMLYASATDPFPVRIQGTLVSDREVENVVDAVKDCWGEPDYIDDEIFVPDEDDEDNQPGLFSEGSDDPLYDKALDIVVQAGKASASYIQRRLSIGYNRAARLIELMEERGIIGPANGSKPREIIHIP